MQRRVRRNAQQIKARSKKRPCQPKTAKRFFGGPVSHGPSGQAKERTRILPVRRGFSAPNVPRHVAGWSFLRGLPLLWRLLCTVPRRFFCKRSMCAGNPLALPVLLVYRVQRTQAFGCFFTRSPKKELPFFCRAPLLFPWPVRCLLLFRGLLHPLPVFPFCVVRTGFLSCFFIFSCLTSSSQISFHLSLWPRRASTFFRKESRQRFARGRGSAPFDPPFLRPAANLLLFRAAGRLNGPSGRNSPADGETLEKAKEQSSAFSSVSVRRGTPAPFRRSPPFSRCWPA